MNNPSLTQYLKISPTDFKSVSIMVKLFDNALFCEHETLSKREQEEVIPKLLENRGFLEVVVVEFVVPKSVSTGRTSIAKSTLQDDKSSLNNL